MAAIVTQTIELDLTPGNISPFLYVSQGDYGSRSLVFNLRQNDQPYSIPSTVTSITLDGITVAGNVFRVLTSFTQGDTQAIGSLTHDMTDVIGMDICHLTFNTSSGVLGTANFYICVEKTPTMTMVKYSNMYYAELAKSWAVGGTGIRAGEDTNNSKYWSDYYNEDIDNRTTNLENRTLIIENRTTKLENKTTHIEKGIKDLDNRLDDVEDFKPWAENRFHSSLTLKTFFIVDNEGNYLIDNDNNKLTGYIYLPVTDKTGELDGYPIDASVVGKTFLMQYENMGLPVMYLDGEGIESLNSKADGDVRNVSIHFPYKNINTTLKKIKIQGASSQYYPKKNYTITFNSDVKLNDSWGSHNKYVLKADWVDFSQMRNEICAKLWGQIRKTRIDTSNALVNSSGDYFVNNSGDYLVGETNPAFSMGLNYGAVDGYPICVVINGKYWGLYSLMIPKDNWMAGMKGQSQYESIISIENGTLQSSFKALITRQDSNGDMYGTTLLGEEVVTFSNEYTSNEDDVTWLKTSLNSLISSVMSQYSNKNEFLEAVSDNVDIDSAIDYYIFNCIVNNLDGMNHNYLLDTWNGQKWYFIAYDMDGTLGNEPSGKAYYDPSAGCTFLNFRKYNKLIDSIYLYDSSDLKARYNYLRSNVLSETNFASLVWNYAVNIPKAMFDYEVLRWPSRPGTNTNNVSQILDFFRLRCQILDAEIEAL